MIHYFASNVLDYCLNKELYKNIDVIPHCTVYICVKQICHCNMMLVDPSLDGRKPLVAGSIGPYGAHLANGSEYNGQYVDELSVQVLNEIY